MKLTTAYPTVAFAWYSREDWQQLWDAAPDREDLDASFDEWELAAVQAELEFQARGITVKRVHVDAAAFLAWCKERRRKPNRGSRSAFVSEVAQKVGSADG
jgi:hypothetical protein